VDLDVTGVPEKDLPGVLRRAEIDARHAGAYELAVVGVPDGYGFVDGRKALPVLRDARDSDGPALIEVIGECFAEYPGCVLDVDGEEPWLREPATAYLRLNGQAWVYALGGPDGPVVACGAIKFGDGDTAELKSLYVSAAARRRRLAQDLSAHLEDAARAAGRRRMQLWSDTRFVDAHALYRGLGYTQLDEQRELHDKSGTVEYRFVKKL
jgi:N-acetylglutamate synthase-like GNAT family acetyltransferase